MRQKTLCTLFLLFLASSAVAAAAQKFSAIYAFGDSYCDVGNVFVVTGTPPPPYYHGRFSNGPIWLDHVAGAMGIVMKPSLLGGTDYAVGGAWVTAPQIRNGFTIPSVPQQVELYLAQHGGQADPNALYILEGGGNDIALTTTGSPDTLGFEVAAGLAGSEGLLRHAGARHFLIPNLFDISMLPAAAGNVTFARAATLATNKWLKVLLGLEPETGVSIVRVDLYDMFWALRTSATHFGFKNITTPCFTTTVCADPDHTLFWDDFHFTEFGQSTMATTVENALIASRWH